VKVALLEIKWDCRSRSRNLQRIIAAIHQAVQRQPAPDLLVLRAAYDNGGALVPREIAGVAEAISWEARHWGVYIVCGLHENGKDEWRGCTDLFDADGDRIASTGDRAREDAESMPEGVVIWHSPHGRILLSESVAAVRLLPAEAVRGAFVAVPLPLALTGRGNAGEWEAVESLVSHDSDRCEAYWALVGVVGVPSPCSTSILGPTGPPLGEVNRGGDIAIVIVDVPIEPPPNAMASGSTGRGDQAD